MITFDTSVLLNLYQPAGAAGGQGVRRRTDPTPPWNPRAQAPQASDLVRSVMEGRRFIDPGAARLDVPGAARDYRNLFALYQGLNALQAIAQRMDARGVGELEQTRLQRRFAQGAAELGTFLDQTAFDKLRMVRGEAAESLRSQAGVRRDRAEYVGPVIHRGTMDQPVAAFDGEVRFTIKAHRLASQPVDIEIDLAEMAAPRTMPNVVGFINGKLEAAGLETRLRVERVPGEPRTVTAGTRTVTLPAEADGFAFRVKGVSVEKIAFAAEASADALWIAQRAGAGDAAVGQIGKFQTDVVQGSAPPPPAARPGETFRADGRVFQSGLPAGVSAARAAAAGPDGSVYVLAEVDATVAGQPIKGERDVALLKYDSAGKLLFTRVLGAASEATGASLTVGPDGRVAVAGAVRGALDKGEAGPDPRGLDSFVTVFDADGVELWTQRRAARDADEALAVTFGADGSVFVAGRARSAMPGASALGGWDSYVLGFSATGAPRFATQFGTAGEDRATALAVDGDALLVGGIENGRAVLRRLELQPSGPPVLAVVRDLGEIQGGSLDAIAVEDGRLIVAGASRNAGLDAGVTLNPHAGGREAFVAVLETDLAASAEDRLTWWGGAGDETVTGAVVSGGKVWLTGQAGSDLPGLDPVGRQDGYAVRIDPFTGAAEWSRRFSGQGGEVAPTALAVVRGGASALDRLGLPQGELDWSDSKRITAATAIRPGDRFFIRADGGRSVAVTVEAADTLATLARKIERASGFKAKVEIARDGDFERLRVKPRDARSAVEIRAGEAGRDALEALGLAEGLVRLRGEGEERVPTYGLRLPGDLRVDSKAAIKDTVALLQSAMAKVRTAYRDLADAGKPKTPQASGPPPQFLRDQLANYQAALARLGGG